MNADDATRAMHELIRNAIADPTFVREEHIGDLYMAVQSCQHMLNPKYKKLFGNADRKRAQELLPKLRAVFRSDHVQGLAETEDQKQFLRSIIAD